MKRLFSVAAVLVVIFAWLTLLFAVDPFTRVNHGLDRAFGAVPAWTQVDQAHMFVDAGTQELTRGDHPLRSFSRLAAQWAQFPTARRIILMGNSQALMTSLAAGEPPPAAPEKVYSDLIADAFRAQGNRAVYYRLAAGALSYEEMLWYATYLSRKPDLKPSTFLIQVNYQNFVNGGIREGMLEMLVEPEFRASIIALSENGRQYSETFHQALQRYETNQRRGTGEQGGKASGVSAGYAVETRFRQQLDRIPGFGRHVRFKTDFHMMLLLCRSYFLRLQPTSRRSLSGARVLASREALTELASLCRRTGIRVILFQAPTNPRAPLYGTPDDDNSYHAFITGLAAGQRLTLFDFEHSIPAPLWGVVLNVPDPLHLSRGGHQRLAALFLENLERSGF